MLSAGEYTAWAGLLYVHATLIRQLDHEMQTAHGLSLSVYEVLLFLTKAPQHQLRMSDLAQSVVLSLSGISRLVDRLERQGLVERQRAKEDGRGNYVVLTDEGLERYTAAQETHVAGIRRLFLDHLCDGDLDALASYWDKIVPHTSQVIQQMPTKPKLC